MLIYFIRDLNLQVFRQSSLVVCICTHVSETTADEALQLKTTFSQLEGISDRCTILCFFILRK